LEKYLCFRRYRPSTTLASPGSSQPLSQGFSPLAKEKALDTKLRLLSEELGAR